MPQKYQEKSTLFLDFPPPRLMKAGVRCHLPYALFMAVFQSTTIRNNIKGEVDPKNEVRFLCNHVQFGAERNIVPSDRVGEKHNYI